MSQTITVGVGGDFATLSEAESSIAPGDTLRILHGIHSDGTQFLENLHGTADAPIVIMADQRHQAIFRGGTESIHFINCSYVEIRDLIIEQQTGNGMNIDDGGDYSTPTHHITIYDCIFRDMAGTGNNDLLKLSGLDSFLITKCKFISGSPGGSGVDMVGCHAGIIESSEFDQAGTSGIQAKGGTQFIRIEGNIFRDMAQRAINLGGSTGLQFFRPPLNNPIENAFEAADLDVFSNIFIRSWSPIAFVGSVRVRVYHNTFFEPENWAIRILQETTEPGFLPCGNNEFINNIIYLSSDLTEVNIGPNTDPESFSFSNNLWFNASDANWSPTLPVTDPNQLIANPEFNDAVQEDFYISPNSPATGNGTPLAESQTDYFGHPFDDPPSIGAIEGQHTTSIDQKSITETLFSIWPNPTSKFFTLDGNLQDINIQIFTPDGFSILRYAGISTPYTVDADRLSEGLYFIRIQDTKSGKSQIRRVLKVR